MNPINFNNYLQITFPQERSLEELLKANNQADVLHFLKNNKVDLEQEIEIDCTVLEFRIQGKVKLMHHFAFKGWNEGINYLAEKGYKVTESSKETEHLTPLLIAAFEDKPETVALLLELGADINQSLPLSVRQSIQDDNHHKKKQFELIKNDIYLQREYCKNNNLKWEHFYKNIDSHLKMRTEMLVDITTLGEFLLFSKFQDATWEKIFSSIKTNSSIQHLFLLTHHPSLEVFRSNLNNFTGNINQKIADVSLFDFVVGCFHSNKSKIKFLELLIEHPEFEQNSIEFSAAKVLDKSKHHFSPELQNNILQKLQGLDEIIKLQMLQISRISGQLYVDRNHFFEYLEDACPVFNYQEIGNSLKTFAYNNIAPGQLQNALLNTMWLDRRKINTTELFETLSEGKIIILSSGWQGSPGHDVSIVICQHQSKIYLMICNRSGGDATGISIYETPHPLYHQNVKEQVLKFSNILNTLQLQNEVAEKFLKTEINNCELLKKMISINHKVQRNGNCTYLSPKTAVRCCFIAPILQVGGTIENAISFSFTPYKNWAIFDRYVFGWDRFLSHPFCQKPMAYREERGIHISRIIQEYLMYYPKEQRGNLLQMACNRLLPEEIQQNFPPLSNALLFENVEWAMNHLNEIDSIKEVGKYCYTSLHFAAWLGNIDMVVALLKKGASITQFDKTLQSPAHLALKNGHPKVAKILIEKMDVVDLTDEKGKTLLFYACELADLDLVKLLLQKKANPNLLDSKGLTALSHLLNKWNKHKDNNEVAFYAILDELIPITDIHLTEDEDGWDALHYAVQTNSLTIIEKILQNYPKIKPSNNFTIHNAIEPALLAFTMGNLETAKKLIPYVKHFNRQDKSGNTLLHYACKHQDVELVKFLVQKNANQNLANQSGLLPLHVCLDYFKAEKPESLGIIDLLDQSNLDYCDKEGMTALHFATGISPLVIEKFLNKGYNINKKTSLGTTPLMFSIKNNPDEKIIKLLLERGADIAEEDNAGLTALHLAAFNNLPAICNLLLQLMAEKSIPIKQKDRAFPSPAHLALKNGHHELALTLVKHVSDINLRDNQDNTLLHYSCSNMNLSLIKDLLIQGADPNLQNSDGELPLNNFLLIWKNNDLTEQKLEVLEILLTCSNLDIKSKNGFSFLHYAVFTESAKVVNILLKKTEWNINAKAIQESTPLKLAMNLKNVAIIAVLAPLSDMLLLDGDGNTPLHAAVYSGNIQIVKIIVEQYIKQGLNIDTLANGVTPLFLAMAIKSLEIFEYLIEKGANVQLKTDGLSVLHAAQVLKLDAFVAKLT